MEFFLADVVGLRMVAQPRELEFKVGSVVADIHDDIRAVGGFLAPLFVQAERFLVKRKRGGKVADVIVFMDHFELHGFSSFQIVNVWLGAVISAILSR